MDTFLDINGLSRHLGSGKGLPEDYDYNEVNTGFGITAEKENNRLVKALMAGRYKNSFNKPSYYAGGSIARRFGNDYYADLGGFAGVVTGYNDITVNHDGQQININEYGRINPLAGAMLNLGKKGVGRIGVKYIPKDKGLLMMNLGIPIR